MGDLPYGKAEMPVSIFDSETGTRTGVTSDNRLQVDAAISNIADPSSLWERYCSQGRAWVVTTGTITLASAGTEYPFLLLDNPVASGRNARINSIQQIFQPGVTLKDQTIKVYRDPTVTDNGTALTEAKVRKSGTLTNVVNTYLSPTVSSTGTLLYTWDAVYGTENIALNLSQYVEEGEKILVTITASISNKDHAIQAWWAEVDV